MGVIDADCRHQNFTVKKLVDVNPAMFGASDDLVSGFPASPSEAFSFRASLSPIEFEESYGFLESPMFPADPSVFADEIAPFADGPSALRGAKQERPSLRPFVSFEATEMAVSRLRTSLK
jgi:hypothetical protein